MANSSSQPLLDRLSAFLATREGAEAIDDLHLTAEQQAAQRADFFLGERRYIVEIKLLSTDTRRRMDAVLEPHRSRPEFALLSKHSLESKLELLPDGEQLRHELHRALTDSVERLVEKANRQIRETRRTFSVADAGGILVILNDEIAQLTPPIVAKRAGQTLEKRAHGGVGLRFTEIDAVWVVSEAHFIQLTSMRRAIADILFPTLTERGKQVAEYLGTISEQWSAFVGRRFVQSDADDLGEYRFVPRPK